MPDRHRMDGGGVANVAAIVDALANDPVRDVFLELSTANNLSRLAIGAAPSTVNVGGGGSAKLSLSGPLGAVRQALQTLEYSSPERFYGVAIHGHMNGEGTWFGSPGATPVCDATCQHSICGYYRLFDDVCLPASMSPARSITIYIDRFREFCLAP